MKKVLFAIIGFLITLNSQAQSEDLSGLYVNGKKETVIDCFDIDSIFMAVKILPSFSSYEKVEFVSRLIIKWPLHEDKTWFRLDEGITYNGTDFINGAYKNNAYIVYYRDWFFNMKNKYITSTTSKAFEKGYIDAFAEKNEYGKNTGQENLLFNMRHVLQGKDPAENERKLNNYYLTVEVNGCRISGYEEYYDNYGYKQKRPLYDCSTQLYYTDIKINNRVMCEQISKGLLKFKWPTTEGLDCNSNNKTGTYKKLAHLSSLKNYIAGNTSSLSASEMNNIAWEKILAANYKEAIAICQEAEKKDANNLYVKGNLAHALLLNGDYQSAMSIYKKYIGQFLKKGYLWESMIKGDFKEFKSKGINSPNMDKALNELKLK